MTCVSNAESGSQNYDQNTLIRKKKKKKSAYCRAVNKNKNLEKKKLKQVPVGSTRWLIFICVDSDYRLGHPAAVEEELGIHAIGTCGSVERQRQAHVPRMTGASSGRMAPEVVARRSAPSRYVHSVMPTVMPITVGHDPGAVAAPAGPFASTRAWF